MVPQRLAYKTYYGGTIVFSAGAYDTKHPYVDFWNDGDLVVMTYPKTATFGDMRRDLTFRMYSSDGTGAKSLQNNSRNCKIYMEKRATPHVKQKNKEIHQWCLPRSTIYLPDLLKRFFTGVQWIKFPDPLQQYIVQARFLDYNGNFQYLLVELEHSYLLLKYTGS